MRCVATGRDLASDYAGVVFYVTNVGNCFPLARLMFKTQENFDVQLTTCLSDVTCVCRPKEGATVIFYKYEE
jgi:hypothetical protein